METSQAEWRQVDPHHDRDGLITILEKFGSNNISLCEVMLLALI